MNEFDDIKAGLEGALSHARGRDVGGEEHRIEVPVVDVLAVHNELGLSQSESADAFGISVATLRNWEQGKRSPRGPARALLRLLHVRPELAREMEARQEPPQPR